MGEEGLVLSQSSGTTEQRRTVIRSLSSDQPVVRGTILKEQDGPNSKEDGKKKKFYAEMKTSNKLEKSRQSARECRARKKLRYQYLDDMIAERERANDLLRDEMTKYVSWCHMLDQNKVPEGLQELMSLHRRSSKPPECSST